MAKHISRTFSRVFPSYHPRVGQSTFFVEKIWNVLPIQISYKLICDLNPDKSPDLLLAFWGSINYSYENDSMIRKGHTIRAGHHFKAGDFLVPKVWSGKPYASKQIQFAPPIEIVKTWDFDIEGSDWFINGVRETPIIGIGFNSEMLAANDGLTGDDLYSWFCDNPLFKRDQSFVGQIICWNENIEY